MTDPAPRASWRATTKRTFEGFTAETEHTPAQLQGLYAACDLLDEADRMQSVVKAEGRVVKGSQGQPVAHPLIAEVRQYRRAAMDSIRQLGVEGKSASSAAASALATKRWSGRRANLTALPDRAPF